MLNRLSALINDALFHGNTIGGRVLTGSAQVVRGAAQERGWYSEVQKVRKFVRPVGPPSL